MRRACLRFAVTFACLVGVFYALTLLPWVDRHVLLPVMEMSARASCSVLQLGGAGTKSAGVVIQGPDYAIAVRRGCDPLEPIVLFGAAVLAFPAPRMRKWVGLVLGALLLFGINLVRIISLYHAGKVRAPWFETLHQEWWPAFFILAAVLMWFAWLRWVRTGDAATA